MEVMNLHVGGITKEELVKRLEAEQIKLNDFAIQLLEHQEVVVNPEKRQVEVVILTVAELTLAEGATLPMIFSTAVELGYQLCPLEVAIFLRLQLLDQVSSSGLVSEHKAPLESLTVASPILSPEDEFPKGLYLRKVDNVNWLRGYCCDDQHIFAPTDRFVFLNHN